MMKLFGNKEFEVHIGLPNIYSMEEAIEQVVYTPLHYLGFLHWLTMDKLDDQNYTNIWYILTNKKLHGAIPSQVQLDLMYSPGNCRTFPIDGPKLTYFLKKDVRNGCKEACMTLGSAYEWGENGIYDSLEAVKWYKRTLELNGDIGAAYRIGIIFYKGRGVKRDLKVALEHLNLRHTKVVLRMRTLL